MTSDSTRPSDEPVAAAGAVTNTDDDTTVRIDDPASGTAAVTTAASGSAEHDSAASGSAGNGSPDTPASVAAFAGPGSGHYERSFARIRNARGFTPVFNWRAALLGPVWAGMRGVWGFFWVAAFVELVAFTQLCRGLFGDLGADLFARAARLENTMQSRREAAETALAAGNTAQAETFGALADNLERAAAAARTVAEEAAAGSVQLVVVGLIALLLIKLVEGFAADHVYEGQYSAWLTDRRVASGVKRGNVLLTAFLLAVMFPLTIYRFTVSEPPAFLTGFPVGKGLFNTASQWLDAGFDNVYRAASGAFDGIRDGIRVIVEAFEVVLVATPWPVVMTVIIFVAWRVAGPRVAIFTTASLAYLGFFGLWELSMQTVALLGTAAVICIGIGIPLGIWFARSQTAYTVARPVLDFMQTMPAFVYLIPVIAFFGTGKPPGIIATLVFGMPPVVRLTALGLKGVPEDVKEAARAYGATKWQLLRGVELPLAVPAIMTGVNQTILMCLSMVVIASLIGAQGLGSVVLEALQYAAKGQGMLAGLAILLCAMVIDRVVQGRFTRTD